MDVARRSRAISWLIVSTVLLVSFAVSSTARAADAAPDPAGESLPFIAVVPRLGLVAYGAGQDKLSCRGDCAGFAGTDTGYVHTPAFSMGVDALFGFGRFLRLGPSFEYTLTNPVDLTGHGAFDVGSDFTVNGAVEGVLPVSPRAEVHARFEGGLLALSEGDDLKRYLDTLRAELCSPGDCPISEGMHVGWNVGVGIGGAYRMHAHGRLRVDLLFQYYSLELYSLGARLFGHDIVAYESLSGGRLFLSVGAEIF
jgi:hypothetical protein